METQAIKEVTQEIDIGNIEVGSIVNCKKAIYYKEVEDLINSDNVLKIDDKYLLVYYNYGIYNGASLRTASLVDKDLNVIPDKAFIDYFADRDYNQIHSYSFLVKYLGQSALIILDRKGKPVLESPLYLSIMQKALESSEKDTPLRRYILRGINTYQKISKGLVRESKTYGLDLDIYETIFTDVSKTNISSVDITLFKNNDETINIKKHYRAICKDPVILAGISLGGKKFLGLSSSAKPDEYAQVYSFRTSTALKELPFYQDYSFIMLSEDNGRASLVMSKWCERYSKWGPKTQHDNTYDKRDFITWLLGPFSNNLKIAFSKEATLVYKGETTNLLLSKTDTIKKIRSLSSGSGA